MGQQQCALAGCQNRPPNSTRTPTTRDPYLETNLASTIGSARYPSIERKAPTTPAQVAAGETGPRMGEGMEVVAVTEAAEEEKEGEKEEDDDDVN